MAGGKEEKKDGDESLNQLKIGISETRNKMMEESVVNSSKTVTMTSTSNHTGMTTSSAKKKKIFSLSRVLRKRGKPKAKSLTDLSHRNQADENFDESTNSRHSLLKIESDTSSLDRNSLDSFADTVDGRAYSSNNESVGSHGDFDVDGDEGGLFGVAQNSIASCNDVDGDSTTTTSRKVITDTNDEKQDGDDEDEEEKSEKGDSIPHGITAETIWKSGVVSFFSVEGEIVAGEGLIARDKSGSSDPYVKVKIRHKCVYKTKIVYQNLFPKWEEAFQLAVDDVNTELVFKVYDFDRLSHDDDMGEARVNLATMEVNKENILNLPLINKDGLDENLGILILKLNIKPKSPNDNVEISQILGSAKRAQKHSSKSQIWDSILSVILVEGRKLKAMDSTGKSDPYIRFKLGTDKYKSKVCKQTLSPVWHEQFDMKMFVGGGSIPPLELSLWDKDSGKDEFMGRASLDLTNLQIEKSHYVELTLEDQPGVVCMHVSITGVSNDVVLNNNNEDVLHSAGDNTEKIKDVQKKFSIINTPAALKEIGWLQIKLHRAVGLAVADIGGSSDPFAVIELGNQRLVSPTIYKTLNPQWDKTYELPVHDIHDVLEITVFDEDKRGAPEFLGRVQIPLLSVLSWEKRLYQLKDKRLQSAAKGHLILTLSVIFNPIRASIRTFNPKSARVLDEIPRFRRQLLQKNVDRLSNLIRSIIATGEFIQSLFTWQYKLRSAFAFTIYILLVMNFDWFMIPLILFLVLLKNYIVFMLSPNRQAEEEISLDDDDDDDDDNDDKSKKGKNKTFREKLEAINNICTLVQNRLNDIASLGERIKNTFNWTVPFLSYLLMVIMIFGTIVLYIVPLRYLLLAWGINKFTKRIRKPKATPNNELLDFLSRIPSDPEVKKRRVLKSDVVLR